MAQSLSIVLAEGFNPYKDNKTLSEFLINRLDGKQESEPVKPKKEVTVTISDKSDDSLNIHDAFELALSLKIKMMSANSFVKYKSRITRFQKWLYSNGFKKGDSINKITKKHIIQCLNGVLQSSSPRNRNNTRTDLASFYQTLEDNEVVQDNFVKKINVLKAVPERNKTYTPTQQEDLFNYMKLNDPVLFLFVQFIAYNLLRPLEVCRLKISDIDLQDKKLYVRAKNKPVKIKIIPDILLNELPDFSNCNTDDFLFTESKIGGQWDTEETNKRDYFTKRFRKVKDHFGLSANYGLYSFRHTFITKLYREMAKTATPFEVKSKLQLITGHSTMKALEQYLRDIDAALPEDYSRLLT